MTTIKYPEVQVQLTGQDGNVFSLAGACGKAARKAGVDHEEINRFYAEIRAAKSYDEALTVMMAWFDCE